MILSHLLPTSITGAGPKEPDAMEDVLKGEPGYDGDPDCEDSFTRCICLWNFSMRVNDARDEIL